MKQTTIILFILIVTTVKIVAQIPNSGFENWINMGSYENPVSWSTLNGTSVSGTAVTCKKESPGLPGNYKLVLTSLKDSISGVMIPGFAVCGKIDTANLKLDTIHITKDSVIVTIDSNSLKPTSGFPFTGRPKYLTGVYEYMTFEASGNAPGYIDIRLTRWDNANHQRENVGYTHSELLGMEMVWAKFSIPLTYSSNSIPDTCIIVFSASSGTPTESDYLHVDGLSFSDTSNTITRINEATLNKGFNVFPNPANLNEITIVTNTANGDNSQLLIYDIVGTLIKSETVKQQQQKINIEDLSNGCYTVMIKNKDVVLSQKLIIQQR